MISATLRTNAIHHAMIELRASGPCERNDIRRALVDQCPGVDDDNADATTDWALTFLRQRRAIVPYGDNGAFDIP